MENEKEFGPQLPTRRDIVDIFLRTDVKEDVKLFNLNRFIAERQKESEKIPGIMVRVNFNISLGNLYLDLGLVDQAERSYVSAGEIFDRELPRYEGTTVPDDVHDTGCYLQDLKRLIDTQREVDI